MRPSDDPSRPLSAPSPLRRKLVIGTGAACLALPSARVAAAAARVEEAGPPLSLHDVQESGAPGDGVTDATAGIQRAIDAASRRGGIVYFPPGRYRVTRRLRFAESVPIEVAGDGPVSELLWACDDHLLEWTHADGCRESIVRDLKITASIPIGAGRAAIRCASRVERSLFDSLLIWGEGDHAVPVGIDMSGLADSTTLRDCQLWGVAGVGVRIGQGSQIVIAGGRVIGRGMRDVASTGVHLTGDNGGVHMIATDLIALGEGLRIENASGKGSNREVFLTHATLDSCRRGLGLYDGTYVSISGCWAASCSRENVFVGEGAPLVNVSGGTIFNAGAVHVDDPAFGAHGIVVHSGSLLLSGVAVRANRDNGVWVASPNVREFTMTGCLVAGNGRGLLTEPGVRYGCAATLFRDNVLGDGAPAPPCDAARQAGPEA